MRLIALIFCLILPSNLLYAGTWCRAYCVVTSNLHAMPQIKSASLEAVFKVEAETGEGLVEKCNNAQGIGIPSLFGKRVLANSYKSFEAKNGLGLSFGTYLKSYVPATISNSCTDSTDRPLMD